MWHPMHHFLSLEWANITYVLWFYFSSDHLPAAGSRIGVYEGAMGNIPDEAALRSAEKIDKMASGLGEEDILLVLISGK